MDGQIFADETLMCSTPLRPNKFRKPIDKVLSMWYSGVKGKFLLNLYKFKKARKSNDETEDVGVPDPFGIEYVV